MDNFDLRKYLTENKLTNQSKLILEEFSFINSDGDKVYKDEKGLYSIGLGTDPDEKLYYHPDYPPTKISDKKEKNPDNLSWEDFQIKFPQVKDDNLAGEVYSIMQEQDAFDSMDYDDEDIVNFMNAASTWTDAEDVADYFDEPASDLGKLIASYYQEKSGYEDYNDQWDNYLDYLFQRTEREGNDIDDWRINESKIHLQEMVDEDEFRFFKLTLGDKYSDSELEEFLRSEDYKKAELELNLDNSDVPDWNGEIINYFHDKNNK